jgi:hypothetical protein
MKNRIAYLWDYDIDEEKFKALLSGKLAIGRLDKKWALLRLLEYAPYDEIIRLIGYKELVRCWPELRDHIRSKSRKRGFDFLAEWLTKHHSNLL